MRPRKRTKTGKARDGRKEGPGDPPSPKRRPSTPLLVAWVLALIFLSSLIYLSRESTRLSDPSAGLPVVKTDNSSKSQTRPPGDQAGAVSSNPGKTQDWATEQPEKMTHSSPLGSDSASESPRRRELPPLAMNRPAPPPAPPPGAHLPDISPKHARVSIVIDDFGPDLGVAKQFASLPFPVTMSVLPHQAHSREIAELAHRKGREVILHLPMEPLDTRENPGRGALLLSMSGDEIRRNISAALDTSPYFDGVNNHMGSRMTRDEQMMKTVLLELKGRDLFFLDSMTTNESKGWKVAMEMKMPTLKRDVFLDDDPSADAVRSQISRLVKIAKLRGTALAIGHPREATLKSLQEAAGRFRKEGIEVVAARDLANH